MESAVEFIQELDQNFAKDLKLEPGIDEEGNFRRAINAMTSDSQKTPVSEP
jgi:hypothetical protein